MPCWVINIQLSLINVVSLSYCVSSHFFCFFPQHSAKGRITLFVIRQVTYYTSELIKGNVLLSLYILSYFCHQNTSFWLKYSCCYQHIKNSMQHSCIWTLEFRERAQVTRAASRNTKTQSKTALFSPTASLSMLDISSVPRTVRAKQAPHNMMVSTSSSNMRLYWLFQAGNSNSLKKPHPINLVSCPCTIDSTCI